jgi:hypothetical protein
MPKIAFIGGGSTQFTQKLRDILGVPGGSDGLACVPCRVR